MKDEVQAARLSSSTKRALKVVSSSFNEETAD
jgi:hypothetical protein